MPTIPRSVWVAYALVAGLFGLQTLLPALLEPPAPPAAAATALSVDFGGTGAIELTRFANGAAYTTVLVRNDSKADGEGTLQILAVDRHGRERSKLHGVTLPKETTTAITVRLPGGFGDRFDDALPARGVAVLRVREKGGPLTIKTREVVVPQVQPSLAEGIVTEIGLGAGALILAIGLLVSWTTKADAPAITGQPKWTPQSWSSNLALGGALLAPIVTIVGLPALTHYAAKTSYTTLSVFYGALVTLAPAVYGLLKVGTPTPAGSRRMFALAAAVTVWATVGQLGTAALIVLELAAARVLSTLSAYAAVTVFAVVALMVASHAIRALFSAPTPAAPAATTPRAGTVPTDPPGLTTTTTITTSPAPASDDWALL